MNQFVRTVFVLLLLVKNIRSWNDGGVLLRDVQVLTLYKGRYTTARRSSPVPQLQCVGGSAGCHAFIPETVQCQNHGWDGVDVQWECRTDMDSAYRFGRVEVSCEGFSHPADDFILAGSCGLEYTLELTEEGRRTRGGSAGGFKGFEDLGGFASTFFSGFSGINHKAHQGGQKTYGSSSEDSAGLLVPAVLLLLAFIVYKFLLSGNMAGGAQEGGQHGFHRDNHQQHFNTGPPPPGFKPDFTGAPGANPSYGFHSDYTQGPHYPGGRAAPSTAGGGFWSGMGTGGLLGYLFGRQRNQPHNYNYSSYNSSRAPPAGGSSSGTRTASGFGGTKRR